MIQDPDLAQQTHFHYLTRQDNQSTHAIQHTTTKSQRQRQRQHQHQYEYLNPTNPSKTLSPLLCSPLANQNHPSNTPITPIITT
jgi:hypothetical protein